MDGVRARATQGSPQKGDSRSAKQDRGCGPSAHHRGDRAGGGLEEGRCCNAAAAVTLTSLPAPSRRPGGTLAFGWASDERQTCFFASAPRALLASPADVGLGGGGACRGAGSRSTHGRHLACRRSRRAGGVTCMTLVAGTWLSALEGGKEACARSSSAPFPSSSMRDRVLHAWPWHAAAIIDDHTHCHRRRHPSSPPRPCTVAYTAA